jgi:hypothetical protein
VDSEELQKIFQITNSQEASSGSPPAIALKHSTLYTTIPHSKLKDRLKELVQLSFIKGMVPIGISLIEGCC